MAVVLQHLPRNMPGKLRDRVVAAIVKLEALQSGTLGQFAPRGTPSLLVTLRVDMAVLTENAPASYRRTPWPAPKAPSRHPRRQRSWGSNAGPHPS